MLTDSQPQLQTVRVPLATQPYQILIGHAWWQHLPRTVLETIPDLRRAILVADNAVVDSWGGPLATDLRNAGSRTDLITIPSGETSKSVAGIARIWEEFCRLEADRTTVVLALGGGVVGDLAGFAAATYARGLRFVQIPTTLLAQVDSSVGGKTGINLSAAKNIVGAFWQPALVLIDTATLQTLPQREYISGLAEIIKYGVVLDREFFVWLEEHAEKLLDRDPQALAHAIATSCRLKAGVVCEDERETTGRRAILNYGHTFAHAIETVTGYKQWLHGEAVAIGMDHAARLAQRLGRLSSAEVARQRKLIERCRLPSRWTSSDAEALWHAMQRDKKVASGKLRFVLPDGIGSGGLVDNVTRETVMEVLTELA
jgi:3-dehydroquinate synthase